VISSHISQIVTTRSDSVTMRGVEYNPRRKVGGYSYLPSQAKRGSLEKRDKPSRRGFY
jgi:hypothetical protein